MVTKEKNDLTKARTKLSEGRLLCIPATPTYLSYISTIAYYQKFLIELLRGWAHNFWFGGTCKLSIDL